MPTLSSLMPGDPETVAELRALYRAAEARAARLRLLSASGRELVLADTATIDAALDRCGRRLAFFLGRTGARVERGGDAAADGPGLPMPAPGGAAAPAGHIVIGDLTTLDDIADEEDRDAARMLIDLMGGAADRARREDERARILADLRDREARLEQLVGRIFTAQEDERRRVSHELHDGVAQTATALLRLLEGATSTGGADLPAAERERLSGIARGLVRELRAIIGGLRPTLLDDLGLEAALRALADGLAADGFDVRFDAPAVPAIWPPHGESALFRVAQEAMANIRKHAGGPCAVSVALTIDADGRCGRLAIRDFGCGTTVGAAGPAAGPGDHIGIDVMRERMAAVGGRLDWHGSASGVAVTAWLSLAALP